MKLLFVADAVHTFAPYKDTTYAMMREANRRGMAIHVCQPHHVHWHSGQGVQAWVQRLTLLDVPTPSKNQPNWYALGYAMLGLKRLRRGADAQRPTV